MTSLKAQQEILAQLREAEITNVDSYTPFPMPFYCDLSKVKAIYLGCDPSNTKYNQRFDYVFALPSGDDYGFRQFVRSHHSNLDEVGLSWETVYVQNLYQNYFTKETSKNYEDWKRATKIWIEHLRTELAIFSESVPVLLTSELLYKVLVREPEFHRKVSEFYKAPRNAPITSVRNALGRPLIPVYRHYKYALAKWPKYAKRVRALVK
jgi:hypothetical protein